MNDDMNHMSFLLHVTEFDLQRIQEKEKDYKGSWKRRGGVGAFMMLARKWDRLEPFIAAHGYDIFEAVRVDSRSEGVIDDIRDLREYLLLVEAELRSRWADEDPPRQP